MAQKHLSWLIQTLRMIFKTNIMLMVLFRAAWLEVGSHEREALRKYLPFIAMLYLVKYLIIGVLFILASCIFFYFGLKLPGIILLAFGTVLAVFFRSRWIYLYWNEIFLMSIGIYTDSFIGNNDRFIKSYDLKTARDESDIYYCYWLSPWQEKIMLGVSDNPAVTFYLAQEKIMRDAVFNPWYQKNLKTAINLPRKDILPKLYPESERGKRAIYDESKPSKERLVSVMALVTIKSLVDEMCEKNTFFPA